MNLCRYTDEDLPWLLTPSNGIVSTWGRCPLCNAIHEPDPDRRYYFFCNPCGDEALEYQIQLKQEAT